MDLAQIVLFTVLGLWLAGVTLVLFIISRFFNKTFKGGEKVDLKSLLESILEKEEKNAKDISKIIKEQTNEQEKALSHIQKIGLVRFNPFGDTGGDQSFSLALLDANQDGLLITGLHTRERTRIYVKDIKSGRSTLRLSKEEQRALEEALKRK